MSTMQNDGGADQNQNRYGENPSGGTSYGGDPKQASNAPSQDGKAKKGSSKAIKILVTAVIVLSVLGLSVAGVFVYKVVKMTATPREALSVSEFTDCVEGMGYEVYDGAMEQFGDGHVYTGNKNRTVLIFWAFDSKRDAQAYYEELLDFYNAESASVEAQISGINFLVKNWSKMGIYYYAEIVDSTVVFLTTEDKDEIETIIDALGL